MTNQDEGKRLMYLQLLFSRKNENFQNMGPIVSGMKDEKWKIW